MKFIQLSWLMFLGILLLFQNCHRRTVVLSKGASQQVDQFIDCFPVGLQAGGKDLWCEASAVFYDGKNLFLANDKDMPGAEAAVFYLPYSKKGLSTDKPIYLTQSALKQSQKFEDFALTPNKKYTFLTTGFDRIKEGNPEWDGYNSLLYWKVKDNPRQMNPKIAHLKSGEKFSVSVRERISKTLQSTEFSQGAPYFKIEGLAATHNTLYFGIREEGKSFTEFAYKVKIVTSSYQFADDSLVLGDDFRVLSDINLAKIAPNLPKNLALSSIEYDAHRKIFWVLTSLEDASQHNDAYLWWATEADLKAGKLTLVTEKSSGQPLHFAHKAEDITPLGTHQLFIIHDDDRNKTKAAGAERQPNQAAYTIVTF